VAILSGGKNYMDTENISRAYWWCGVFEKSKRPAYWLAN
jgi:hypothetical protein